VFWPGTDFDKDPPTRFPARRFSLPCPADLRESQQTTAYPRCRTVKGLRGTVMRPSRTPFYGLSSCDTKNANASIAAVIVTATPEPVFTPTYRFDS